MKWKYGVKNKMKLAGVLCLILGVVFWNNLHERSQINQLEKSFSSIYEDRLVVEALIFDLSGLLHRRQALLAVSLEKSNQKLRKELQGMGSKVESILAAYADTELTSEEESLFEELNFLLQPVTKGELSINHITKVKDASLSEEIMMEKALANLSKLSEIQKEEGSRLIDESKNIMLSTRSSAQLEVAILVVLAILIQSLLFSSNSLIEKIQQKPHLN